MSESYVSKVTVASLDPKYGALTTSAITHSTGAEAFKIEAVLLKNIVMRFADDTAVALVGSMLLHKVKPSLTPENRIEFKMMDEMFQFAMD
jgi:hypothetical protein